MHDSIHLSQIVILLCAAVFIVGIFRALRISPVLGYLVAGVAIGPSGLSLIEDVKTTSGIAEFGVIFLLFLIGLELSLERLRSMRKHVFGFGSAQVFLSSLLFICFFMGLGGAVQAAIIIGGGLALSSTAIVLQVIAEQNEKSSQVGRLALAILILQDIAVIPLLVFVAMLTKPDASLSEIITYTLLKAFICLSIIFIAGRLLLRPLFRFIASLENTELFSATTLLILLGVAWLSSLAGLSPALGAFLAGLLIAETEFKHQVEADILPFKGLLLGLFFMTVGMSLNLDMLLYRFGSIIGLTIALMGCKALIIMGLCRIFRFHLGVAVHVGLLLSQGGEFAFILFSLAAERGLLHNEIAQILLVVVTLSMALTPLIGQLGKKIAVILEKLSIARPETILEETLDLRNHVIVSGFGRVGHTVAKLLESENVPYVVIDIDSYLVSRERKAGLPIYYGDTARVHVLKSLGIERARALIITHNDTRIALQTIAAVRDINAELPIVARARNFEQVVKLEKAGANRAVAEMFEVSLQLGASLLKKIGIADHEITRIIEIYREEDYALTRNAENDPALKPHA